jgi:ubiquitin carboxyl-terminal hydrolase 7
VEVEVEIDVEVDENDEVDIIADDNHQATNETQVNHDETNSEMDPGSESPAAEEVVNDDADKPTILRKTKTVVRKETKESIVPISHALRALKATFNSLHNNPSSSGSTSILCRTLGINPYLQQDGQEFWKLFIPEIDYSKLARLYSGYYDDYVREIVPESETRIDDEMVVASDDYGEEKKDDEEFESISIARGAKNDKARERKRIEPFLDLSIPVAEGTR